MLKAAGEEGYRIKLGSGIALNLKREFLDRVYRNDSMFRDF